MTKRLSLPYILLLLLLAAKATAQQDPQFSQYMFNKLYFNPAVAGIDPDFGEAVFIHRSQWLGYNPTFDDGGAPTTQSLSLTMPFPRKQNFEGNLPGWGLNVVNDKYGAYSSQEMHLSLAHHIKMKSGELSIGIRGGFYNQSIDFDKYRWVDETDPLNVSGRRSDMRADFSAGLYFHNAKYFVGLGVNRLLGGVYDFNLPSDAIDVNGFTQQVLHANLMGGYNWEANRDWVISPSAIIKYAADANISWEASVLATYDDKYYGGVSYRDGDAAILLLGMNLMQKKQLRLGYAFDLVTQGRNAKSATSQEIRLTYRIPPMIVRVPSIIRTPRYKHF